MILALNISILFLIFKLISGLSRS